MADSLPEVDLPSDEEVYRVLGGSESAAGLRVLRDILKGFSNGEFIEMAGSFIPVDSPRERVLEVLRREGTRRAEALLRQKQHVQATMVIAAAQSPTALIYVAAAALREHPDLDDPVRSQVMELLGENAKLIGTALDGSEGGPDPADTGDTAS
jgi:hypothetical protein